MKSFHRTLLTVLASALAGILLTVVIIVDPLNLHPFNERWFGAAGEQVAGAQQLWTCGMHPQVLLDEPGTCPICHMELVPLEAEEAHTHELEELWTCPMHPNILEHEPGRCPICGMDLVRVEVEDESSDTGVGGTADAEQGAPTQGAIVSLEPSVIQTMNVRTAPVERRDLAREIRTVGYLEYDPERMVSVTTKYPGWVEKVYVNYVGEQVRRGQALFEIYAPELVQTEQELLSALDFAARMARLSESGDATGTNEDALRRAEALVEAARTRLRYWDIRDEQVAELERTREVFRTLTVTAPASGVVMKRMDGLEGMAVRPGMETFHLVDLSELWLSVEVFEDQIGDIARGITADVHFSTYPGETFHGTVRFLAPELSEQTRTLGLKLAVSNRDGRLRPGMYATVELQPVIVPDALTVPSGAVLRTGERDVVVVSLGGGRFAPRAVTVGHELQGRTQLLDGVSEGEHVVTSAQFLLDSESNLRTAIQRLTSQQRPSQQRPSQQRQEGGS